MGEIILFYNDFAEVSFRELWFKIAFTSLFITKVNEKYWIFRQQRKMFKDNENNYFFYIGPMSFHWKQRDMIWYNFMQTYFPKKQK